MQLFCVHVHVEVIHYSKSLVSNQGKHFHSRVCEFEINFFFCRGLGLTLFLL